MSMRDSWFAQLIKGYLAQRVKDDDEEHSELQVPTRKAAIYDPIDPIIKLSYYPMIY